MVIRGNPHAGIRLEFVPVLFSQMERHDLSGVVISYAVVNY